MYVGGVWMRLSMYRSAQAFYGTANALHLKIFFRQNSTHLTVLKHQNTKTSLYKLSKNIGLMYFLKFSGPSEKKLQSTVINDHPVDTYNIHINISIDIMFVFLFIAKYAARGKRL